MKFVPNFNEFLLLEAVVVNEWISRWSNMPEGKLLRLMGFIDETKPDEKRRIRLSLPGHHDIFRLTQAGYVRIADQGFLFGSKKQDPLPDLLGYLIKRFIKKRISNIPEQELIELCREHPELTEYLYEMPELQSRIEGEIGRANRFAGTGLTPAQIKWLNNCTERKGTWTFNEATGEIDVRGSFEVKGTPWGQDAPKNPRGFRGLRFGNVTEYFVCARMGLRSLNGAPHTVGGNFDCRDNLLTSLEGGPSSVGGNYTCEKNQLVTLNGSPTEFNGSFDCRNNHLTSLDGIPRRVKNLLTGGNPNLVISEMPCEISENFSVQSNAKVESLKVLFRCNLANEWGINQFRDDPAGELLAKLQAWGRYIKHIDATPDLALCRENPQIVQYLADWLEPLFPEISNKDLEAWWVYLPKENEVLKKEIQKRGLDLKKFDLLRKFNMRSASGLR